MWHAARQLPAWLTSDVGQFMRIALPILAFVLSFLAAGQPFAKKGWEYAGRADARSDLREGRFLVEEYGMYSGLTPIYHRLFKERFNVDFRQVAGCVVDSKIVEHAAGYNAIMFFAIERRYGKGAIKRFFTESCGRRVGATGG
jgi:hypothetical protein